MNEVSPERFQEAVFAYQKTAAIIAAVHLDVFSAIQSGADTPQKLAKATGASARGLRVLCDFLTVQGFLEKQGNTYHATPSTKVFLDRRSPQYVGGVVDFLCSPEMLSVFLDDPEGYVRNGGSAGLANIAPDNPVWVKFAESMGPFMMPVATELARHIAAWSKPPQKVLDIAAGHGMFGIAVAQAVPGSRIVALDWQGVLAVARRNAEQAGISDRFELLPGSAFDVDWGTDFDLILLPNFLHHFDEDTCVKLLTKARHSLSAQGQVIAVEFVPDKGRVSPPMQASFAFVMLASTPSGDAYTADEYDSMASRAGFKGAKVVAVPPTTESLVLFERS